MTLSQHQAGATHPSIVHEGFSDCPSGASWPQSPQEANAELVIDEKWHQRWYRERMTKKDSEMDTLLIFKESGNADFTAIHVGNKPAAPPDRMWEPLEADNSRAGGGTKDQVALRRFSDGSNPPLSILATSPREAGHFDIVVAYENIRATPAPPGSG
jgi:hypothetical protein